MVIQIEYGYTGEEPVKTQVRRGVLNSHLNSVIEQFFSQTQYKWGRLYTISGKEKKLIRQF